MERGRRAVAKVRRPAATCPLTSSNPTTVECSFKHCLQIETKLKKSLEDQRRACEPIVSKANLSWRKKHFQTKEESTMRTGRLLPFIIFSCLKLQPLQTKSSSCLT